MLFIHFKTIFSFKFYHRLCTLSAMRTAGFGLYLYILAIIVLFFFTGSFIKTNLPVFLKNFPQVTFEKGVLTAPKEPVSAPIPGTDFQLVFDASAKNPPSMEELIRQNTLAWVHQNNLYIPSGNHLQIQELPPRLNVTTSQQVLQENQAMLGASLRAAFFIISLPLVFLFMAVDFGMALGVLLFFNVWHGGYFSKPTLLKLACFLLGPLTILWLLQLWIDIPLFALAQLLVCIIYVQQIFNARLEVFPHEN